MSAKQKTPTTHEPYCGCLGCGEQATAVIDHPRHGERVVCDRHATGFEVLEYV